MIYPKVKLRGYSLLNGSEVLLVCQVGDGSIIKRFDKTPLPLKKKDVICPHFLELKWGYGCPYDCAWCYLKGTFRFLPTKTRPMFKDYQKIEAHVIRFFEELSPPEILNTGEIADSLMGETLSLPFSKFIIPLFERQDKHKVLFLTKSDRVEHLLSIQSHNQSIISFSLNADKVAKEWENRAPNVASRINAGRLLDESGYEVRIRIDPIVPIPNWEKQYKELIDKVFSNYTPARITLGSLRGLQSTINGSTDRSWLRYLDENSNWGKKVRNDVRFKIYNSLISYLREQYGYSNVALCKETMEIWNELGMDYREIKCNCIW
jgi:spore photoproduct lyase